MLVLITVFALLAAIIGWFSAKTYKHVMPKQPFAVGDSVRVKQKPEGDIKSRMLARGIVHTLAKAMMGKSGTIVETSDLYHCCRIKFTDAGAHLANYYVPHNCIERIGGCARVNERAKS
jgi:hypothetical protein